MYNRHIKKFSIEGVIGNETTWSQTRWHVERSLEDIVRAKGYLPVRDIDTGFFIQYDPVKDFYKVEITMYGIYVGKRKASEWDGYLMGKLLPMDKSKKLSAPLA